MGWIIALLIAIVAILAAYGFYAIYNNGTASGWQTGGVGVGDAGGDNPPPPTEATKKED